MAEQVVHLAMEVNTSRSCLTALSSLPTVGACPTTSVLAGVFGCGPGNVRSWYFAVQAPAGACPRAIASCMVNGISREVEMQQVGQLHVGGHTQLGSWVSDVELQFRGMPVDSLAAPPQLWFASVGEVGTDMHWSVCDGPRCAAASLGYTTDHRGSGEFHAPRESNWHQPAGRWQQLVHSRQRAPASPAPERLSCRPIRDAPPCALSWVTVLDLFMEESQTQG